MTDNTQSDLLTIYEIAAYALETDDANDCISISTLSSTLAINLIAHYQRLGYIKIILHIGDLLSNGTAVFHDRIDVTHATPSI